MTKDGRSFDHLASFFVIFGSVTDHLTSFFCHFWFGDQPWFVTEPKMTKSDVRWSNDRPSFVIFGSVTNHLTDHLTSFFVIVGSVTNHGWSFFGHFRSGDKPSNVVFFVIFCSVTV